MGETSVSRVEPQGKDFRLAHATGVLGLCPVRLGSIPCRGVFDPFPYSAPFSFEARLREHLRMRAGGESLRVEDTLAACGGIATAGVQDFGLDRGDPRPTRSPLNWWSVS